MATTENIHGIKNEIKSSALELIGNTPLVALDRLHPGPGRILAKCEFMNACASNKSRSALFMVKKAIENGELKPGGHVLEITSGNQGCGLSVVCAVLGHPATMVMSQGNSIQRTHHIEALGAKCVRVPQVTGNYGNVTGDDIQVVIAEGIRMSEELNAYFVNQLQNESNTMSHYETTGPEIWRQTGHRVDAFVTMIGTAGTFTGTTKFLKEKNPNLKGIVVEPAGAEAVKGDPITKPCHIMQGAGYGMVPQLFKYEYCDGTIAVTDEEAVEYKNLLGTKEGLYVGYSSGANVAAAVKLLQSGQLAADAWVVTTLNDSGLKYTPLSGKNIETQV